jgi:ABC-type lipoprotein release transport system permease subunit
VPARLQTFRLAAALALRITRSRARDSISVVTGLSIVGIACGVFALTVVIAVSDGFERAFQERILGIYPHLMVTRTRTDFDDWREVRATVAASPGVTGATPLSHHRMMASRGPARAEVSLQGVDPETLGDVIDLPAILRQGALGALSARPSLSPPVGASGEVRLTVSGLVTGGVHTVILEDGGAPEEPRGLLVEDHLRPPEVGRAFVRVLDLRDGAGGEVKLLGRTESGSGGTRGSGEALVFSPRAGTPTPDASAPAGLWRLEATGELLELREGWVHLLVLDTAAGGKARGTLLAEPHEPQAELTRASVRVLDLRTRGPKVTLLAELPGPGSEARSARPFATLSPGPAGPDGPPLPNHTPFTPLAADLPPVFLGSALADKLRAGIGDALAFVTIQRALGLDAGTALGQAPSAVRLRVAGIFTSGFHEQDVSLAITHLDHCARFMREAEVVEALAVRTASVLTLDATRDSLKRALDPIPMEDLLTQAMDLDARLETLARMGDASPFTAEAGSTSPFLDRLESASRAVELLRFNGTERATAANFVIFDWRDKNANHLSVIELQKIVLTIFFFIIVLVGSFVVVGSQIMIIHEKTADIAILKTIGGTSGFIRLVFTLQGAWVAGIGVLAGLVAGLGGVWLIDAVDYELEAAIYFIDRLPVEVDPVALVFVALGALACTLLTTQLSAARAARREPVDGLRQVD